MKATAQRLVLVGVDRSQAATDALRWAAEEARLRNATVRAVYAWQQPATTGRNYIPPEVCNRELLQSNATRLLDEAVDEVVADCSDVEIERVVTEGPAAKVLVEAADDADLLVVGSRGHGGFAGLLLGSVSTQCVQHAPCPVVIVRDHHAAPGVPTRRTTGKARKTP